MPWGSVAWPFSLIGKTYTINEEEEKDEEDEQQQPEKIKHTGHKPRSLLARSGMLGDCVQGLSKSFFCLGGGKGEV